MTYAVRIPPQRSAVMWYQLRYLYRLCHDDVELVPVDDDVAGDVTEWVLEVSGEAGVK